MSTVFLVGVVARLDSVKCFSVLLSAILMLNFDGRDVRVVIIGDANAGYRRRKEIGKMTRQGFLILIDGTGGLVKQFRISRLI